MSTAIDLAIIAVVAFCAWRGYRNGLIRGAFGVAALIFSIFLANITATAYSDEFTSMLRPFFGGVVDTALAEMIEERIGAGAAIGGTQVLYGYEDYETAFAILQRIGLPESAAEQMADLAATGTSALSDNISNMLSSTFAFVAVFGIAFILLMIIFAVVGNLISVVFSLPGLWLVDSISGAVFGLFKGLVIIYALGVIVRYMGLLAPSLLEDTRLLGNIVNSNPVANMLGI